MNIEIREIRNIEKEKILDLYRANKWSSAKKPAELFCALKNSHSLVSAWSGEQLVGIGSAISDGSLVVFYPHLLVHPDFKKQGIGTKIMNVMKQKYNGFHAQILTTDAVTVGFYEKLGFQKDPDTISMSICTK